VSKHNSFSKCNMSLRCKMYQIMLKIVKFKHSHCCSSDLRLCQRQEQLLRQQSGQDEVRCSLHKNSFSVNKVVKMKFGAHSFALSCMSVMTLKWKRPDNEDLDQVFKVEVDFSQIVFQRLDLEAIL